MNNITTKRLFLTVINRYQDNLGIWRYENVSWPVYKEKDYRTYSVKDVDGRFFDCDVKNCIFTHVPSQLVNMDPVEYIYLRRVPDIKDYDAAYKHFFGVDQSINVRAQHAHGVFDHVKKKEMINENSASESPPPSFLERNLYIQPESV